MTLRAHTFLEPKPYTNKVDPGGATLRFRTIATYPVVQAPVPSQAFSNLLIIDSQPGTLEQLQELFGPTGLAYSVATNGPDGLRLLYEQRPQLVLLSLVLPGMDGWETLRHIRALSDVPVILLVTSTDAELIERGFDAGAVDVIAKPFASRVLLARIRAALRTGRPLPTRENGYADAHLRIDPDRQLVLVAGEEIKLTSTERKLLFFLLDHADQICTFEEILEHVWGWEYTESKQYVHIYISRLRQRIERDPKQPHYLLTEHGVGYQFRCQRVA